MTHNEINDKVPAALKKLVERSLQTRTRNKLNVKLTRPQLIGRDTVKH